MIFVTTFILTLILSYVARAVPACGDAAPPEELYRDEAEYYEPYEVTFDAQSIIPEPVWWDTKYDNPNGNTHNVTCSNLAPHYPHFNKIPHWPYIGASFDVKPGRGCGKCWKLTYPKSKKSISFLAVDHTPKGFKIGKKVYTLLTGGTAEPVQVQATMVPLSVCGYK